MCGLVDRMNDSLEEKLLKQQKELVRDCKDERVRSGNISIRDGIDHGIRIGQVESSSDRYLQRWLRACARLGFQLTPKGSPN